MLIDARSTHVGTPCVTSKFFFRCRNKCAYPLAYPPPVNPRHNSIGLPANRGKRDALFDHRVWNDGMRLYMAMTVLISFHFSGFSFFFCRCHCHKIRILCASPRNTAAVASGNARWYWPLLCQIQKRKKKKNANIKTWWCLAAHASVSSE